MKIAIISDIHDHLWNLSAALASVRDSDVLICCGDLCSPFVVDELTKFERDIHIVFGNNDADLYRITAKALKKTRCHVHGELFESEFDGKHLVANHFDYIARPIAKSGEYDVVCFGHNHEVEISRTGRSLLINPGAIMGAKFSSGTWEDTAATFVVYDSASNAATAFGIDPKSRAVRELPK